MLEPVIRPERFIVQNMMRSHSCPAVQEESRATDATDERGIARGLVRELQYCECHNGFRRLTRNGLDDRLLSQPTTANAGICRAQHLQHRRMLAWPSGRSRRACLAARHPTATCARTTRSLAARRKLRQEAA